MEHQNWTPVGRWWSGEHRAALHRFVVEVQAGKRTTQTPPTVVLDFPKRTGTAGDLPMTLLYHVIRYADGRTFYEGTPLTLADAQVMLNDAILDGRVEVGSFLHIEPDHLLIQPPDASPG